MIDKRALFLGSHTDDIEHGCGGYLQRFKNKLLIAFSPAVESIPTEFEQNSTKNELICSSNKIGCNYQLHELRVWHFPESRQYILEALIKAKKEFKPEIVFTHCSTDNHQDHQVLHNETLRAFKDCSILGYDIGHNNYKTNFNFFVELSASELNNKIEFLKCYKSQLAKKDYIGVIELNAEFYGSLLGKRYVEPYELIRWIE